MDGVCDEIYVLFLSAHRVLVSPSAVDIGSFAFISIANFKLVSRMKELTSKVNVSDLNSFNSAEVRHDALEILGQVESRIKL